MSRSSIRSKRRATLESVLIVEDNPIVREVVGKILSIAGYSVLEAETGEQALNICGLSKPDLIILDDRLPGMNGIAVAKSLNKSLRIPFMVLTASSDQQQLKAYIALGASNYIIKPVIPENIVPAVQSAFHNGRNINNLVDKSIQDNYIGRGIASLMLTKQIDENTALAELKLLARNERKKLWSKAKELFDQSVIKANRN